MQVKFFFPKRFNTPPPPLEPPFPMTSGLEPTKHMYVCERRRSKIYFRYQYAQELVTHDAHNNTYDYKHSFSVELVPICKDDLVCLSKKLAQSLGNIGRLCLCSRVSNLIHLIDPNTGQVADLSSTDYWRYPFEVLCYPKMAVEFTIIDIEPAEINLGPGHGPVSNKVIKNLVILGEKSLI